MTWVLLRDPIESTRSNCERGVREGRVPSDASIAATLLKRHVFVSNYKAAANATHIGSRQFLFRVVHYEDLTEVIYAREIWTYRIALGWGYDVKHTYPGVQLRRGTHFRPDNNSQCMQRILRWPPPVSMADLAQNLGTCRSSREMGTCNTSFWESLLQTVVSGSGTATREVSKERLRDALGQLPADREFSDFLNREVAAAAAAAAEAQAKADIEEKARLKRKEREKKSRRGPLLASASVTHSA